MKKVTFLLATLLIGSMMLTGCKKDDPQPTPTPGPTPTPATKTITYILDKTCTVSGSLLTVSPCFRYTFTYKDADGKMVEVVDATLPWIKEINVKTPFEAEMKGKITYNENDLPDYVYWGAPGNINVGTSHSTSGGVRGNDKQEFLEIVAQNPEKLEFSYTKTIE